MVNVQCHVFLEIIQHRLLECLDGWEEKLNYQQCQQTAALANSCIWSFEGSNVRYKSFNQRISIRTAKLTCSRVTKTNYNLHGNQSKLPLFCVKLFQFRISKHRLCSWDKNHCQISSFCWMFVYQSQKFTWNHSQVP